MSVRFLFTFSIFFLTIGCKENSSSKQSLENFASPQSLYAQSKSDDIANSRRNAITQAVAVASPTVVGINVTEERTVRVNPFGDYGLFQNDPFFQQFFQRQSRTYKQEVKSLGSGFFISTDGYIITNSHVAGNATKIVVTTTDGKQHNAKLIGADNVTDVALLKVEDGDNFPYLKFANSDEVIVGEWAIAIGNPFGLFEINDKPTVTVGVVSSIGLNFPDLEGRAYKGMIQTDAAINSGNSGGPLVNSNAEVMGVNTFIYTGGGAGSIGIGFSIPINRVKKIVDELKAKGSIDRSFKTGITVQTVNEGLAQYFGLTEVAGAVVTNVERRSAGDKAGLKVGDIIVAANDTKVKNEQELIGSIRELRAGDLLKLKVFRDKKMLDLVVKLEK